MALTDPETVKLAFRRYTEEGDPHRGTNLAPQTLGIGTFVFGAVVEGAFVPLIELKAGGVLKKIERHKAAQTLAEKDSSQASPASEAPTAITTPASAYTPLPEG